MKNSFFDILVVGGGHAGVEAAHICAKFNNLTVGLVTLPGVPIGSAPCNPSIGGVGKGQVVRELDALGGLMPALADKAGIQYRTLNESKGYAVQSTRVQIDKELYAIEAESFLNQMHNIQIIREKVLSITPSDSGYNVKTDSSTWNTRTLIMTVGTFLNGKLHIGDRQKAGGRMDCESSSELKDIFKYIKTAPKRFKTGTPPRLKTDTIDFSCLEEQASDGSVHNFNLMSEPYRRNVEQKSCYLARTSEESIAVIKDNLHLSPMYSGQIQAVGARYCPSIEDKVSRYPDKFNHHVFIEPETLSGELSYPSGISSSLPADVQNKLVKAIKGLETAEIAVYGYAVEYDVVDTTELDYTLEHKQFPGLYFAGQVNGTSGYEEAAGQGYVAGVNAALCASGSNHKFVLSRHESYIGVMIEDLISNVRDEPYRLFTARSENRLYIREDNAVLRLSKHRKDLGFNDTRDLYNERFVKTYNYFEKCLNNFYLDHNHNFAKIYRLKVPRRMSFAELMKQSQVDPIGVFKQLLEYLGLECDDMLVRCVAISTKYAGYIQKSQETYIRVSKMDSKRLEWQSLLVSDNISFECKRRIEKIKPSTFGQLKLIEGIRPATLAYVAGRL